MNVQAALVAALVYLLVQYVDRIIGDQTLQRPIVMAPIVGLFLGDLHTGIIMAAQLEAIFMGISAIGGAVASDAVSATAISVAYAIVVGGEGAIETGMALAMTIGVLMTSVQNIFTPVWGALAPWWERQAAKAEPKRFAILNFAMAPLYYLPQTIVIFAAIAFGVGGLESAIAACPPWVMAGLTASSSIMTAVGFGILLSMIWDPQICAFYFVGFVMAKSLGLSSLGIAIIGACVALTYFFVQKNIVDATKTASAGAVSTGANSEEDFF